MITVVVPSPTSSSCVRLSSIMLFAAGCDTSISRRMAWPSLVSTMPPMGSNSIFSMALGPRQDRMMSATLEGWAVRTESLFGGRSAAWDGNQTHILAAVMLDNWAFRPVCRSPLAVSVESCASAWESPPGALESSTGALWWGGRPTHNQYGGLHLDSFATGCTWKGIKGVKRSNQGVTIASSVLERREMLVRHCVKRVAVDRSVYFLRPSFTKSARAGYPIDDKQPADSSRVCIPDHSERTSERCPCKTTTSGTERDHCGTEFSQIESNRIYVLRTPYLRAGYLDLRIDGSLKRQVLPK